MGGCVHCSAAGRLTRSLGTAFTNDELVAIGQAQEALGVPGTAPQEGDAALITQLHSMCKFGRACTCQHDHPWEQGDTSDVPEYLDALPADDPRRIEYEAHVKRKIR